MGQELGTGMQILLIIVLIMILIGIVFGIYSFISSNTEEQQGNMESNVAAMTSSVMNKYDQTKVSGSNVVSAINLYKDDEFIIVVDNLKHGASTPYGTGAGDIYGSYKPTGNVTPASDTEQYAVVDGIEEAASGDAVAPSAANGFRLKDQSALKNTAHAGYIRSTAKYNAFLIKDAGQQVVGIHFIQQK